MNDPYNTQAYANEPYTREAWLDLVQRVDCLQRDINQLSRLAHNRNILHFEDAYYRSFHFKKTGGKIALKTFDSGGYSTIFEIRIFDFRKVLHELNSFLKGG